MTFGQKQKGDKAAESFLVLWQFFLLMASDFGFLEKNAAENFVPIGAKFSVQ